ITAVLGGGLAALDDQAAMHAAARRNAIDRTEFFQQAKRRKLSPIASATNFVMIDTGRPVRIVIEHFKRRNILVGRPFPPLASHLRVSLGLPDEMAAFWRAWDELPAAG